MKTERTGELVVYLLEQHGPQLRELGRIRERVKAMNKTRLELVKANNSLKKKLGEII